MIKVGRKVTSLVFLLLGALIVHLSCEAVSDKPFGMINKMQTYCELHALKVGSALSDAFNMYDENTEWDMRLHSEYLTEHLGFAPWMQDGTWRSHGLSAEQSNASDLQHKGGWMNMANLSGSSYWAFENQWVYVMGDSTVRQVWATVLSGFAGNNFERNAKEWTRENCARQAPHRHDHPPGGYFPDEGWGGKCGNNEVTCNLAGFGPTGIVTFDWKHFPYEDYDQWLFGLEGKWKMDPKERRPDILVVQTGLHTCFHAYVDGLSDPTKNNHTMVTNHIRDLPLMMESIKNATSRPTSSPHGQTMVIIMLAGRIGGSGYTFDHCTWRFNGAVRREAHRWGFAVLEREEIERRMLFKSEHFEEVKYSKSAMHLDNPGPQITATSLLALAACLRRNGSLPISNGEF